MPTEIPHVADQRRCQLRCLRRCRWGACTRGPHTRAVAARVLVLLVRPFWPRLRAGVQGRGEGEEEESMEEQRRFLGCHRYRVSRR